MLENRSFLPITAEVADRALEVFGSPNFDQVIYEEAKFVQRYNSPLTSLTGAMFTFLLDVPDGANDYALGFGRAHYILRKQAEAYGVQLPKIPPDFERKFRPILVQYRSGVRSGNLVDVLDRRFQSDLKIPEPELARALDHPVSLWPDRRRYHGGAVDCYSVYKLYSPGKN